MRLIHVANSQTASVFVSKKLATTGATVDRIQSVEDGLFAVTNYEYDALVLDVRCGEPDRLCEPALVRAFRAAESDIPILALTTADDVCARVECLDNGVDDCLAAPFDFEELAARMRALFRRRHGLRSGVVSVGDLEFDCNSNTAQIRGDTVWLTQRERSTLAVLVAHRGKPVHKERIHHNLYGLHDSEVGVSAVEIYIARIRKKLQCTNVSIKTIRNVGYQLCM